MLNEKTKKFKVIRDGQTFVLFDMDNNPLEYVEFLAARESIDHLLNKRGYKIVSIASNSYETWWVRAKKVRKVEMALSHGNI